MTSDCKEEDIFDEEAKETEIDSKHWETLMSYRMNDGLRDGMTEGHDNCLQDSFNQGFQDGFRSVYNVSILRGISRTFCLKGVESEAATKIYEKLGCLEHSVLEALKDNISSTKSTETPVLQTESEESPRRMTNLNSPSKLPDSKKLEIEGNFVELKDKCLQIAKNLDNASLALTINAVISNLSF